MPFEDRVTIGSDFASDLMLMDPGIAEHHAVLSMLADGRYDLQLIDASHGAGFHQTDVSRPFDSAMSGQVVEPGQVFELVGVRLLVCQSDAEWDFALPVTAAAKAAESQVPLSAIDLAVAEGMAAGRLGAGVAQPAKSRTRLGRRELFALSAGIVAIAIVAWLLVEHSVANEAPAPAPRSVVQRVYSEAQVQEIASHFAQRLDELNVPLLKLVTAPQQLTVQGVVDRNAESRFESAVQDLREAHPGLKVRLDLGSNEASVLPFEITAAVGGPSGSVLLSDGQQLFVGAEEAGFKFLGLVGNCLTFLQLANQQKVSQCSDPTSPRR